MKKTTLITVLVISILAIAPCAFTAEDSASMLYYATAQKIVYETMKDLDISFDGVQAIIWAVPLDSIDEFTVRVVEIEEAIWLELHSKIQRLDVPLNIRTINFNSDGIVDRIDIPSETKTIETEQKEVKKGNHTEQQTWYIETVYMAASEYEPIFYRAANSKVTTVIQIQGDSDINITLEGKYRRRLKSLLEYYNARKFLRH